MAESPDWEVLDLPPEVEIARKTRKSDADLTQGNAVEKKDDERLCGYLQKLGAKGIKTWKRRWFVFEPRRCILYYYRTSDCTDPLGNIEISNASFSFSPNATNKGQFEIRSAERTYYLQAPDKETMQFWLQELKAERSKFTRRQSNLSGIARPSSSVLKPTSGLLSNFDEGEEVEGESDDLIMFAEPIKKPSTVGESSRTDSNQPLANLSLSNLKTEFSNWRKSGMFNNVPTGEVITSPSRTEGDDKPSQRMSTIRENSPNRGSVKRREGRQSRSVDFGFMNMSAALKRRTFWGSQSTSFIESGQQNGVCRDCEEFKEILSTLKEAIQIAEKEIKTRDEVIESLHEQIRNAFNTRTQSCTSPEADPESLEEKDSYIEQLINIVKKIKSENEDLKLRNEDKDNRITELNEKIDVLQEMITNKDDAIVGLTNQIFAIDHPETAEDVFEENVANPENTNPVPPREPASSEHLKEACNAYMEQNKLLNSEILELVKMRKHDNDIVKDRDTTIASLEAELCKIKSRYVILLKEYSTPLRDGYHGKERDQEMIQHLLDDAVNQDVSSDQEKSENLAAKKAADQYGFYDTIDTEDEDALTTLAEKLDEKSTDASSQHGNLEMSVGVKWENFLVAQGKKPILKSEDVKALVRQGIPHEYRARVWQDLINHYVRHERETAGPGYFYSLLEDRRGTYTPAEKQIELDLLRTLPNNKYYDRVDSEGTSKLRKVLLAYSWHNPNVGYCQGLNRLGAIALLYLNEEDAFWCLVAIVEHLMPRDYYSRTIIGAQIDQRVFKELFDEKLPKLSALFKQLPVDLSLLSFNWFLAVFVDIFPVELTLRVWDTFLYEGNKVLFRYSLALFKSCEEDLLKLKESGDVYKFFRRIPSQRMNPHRIYQIAFQMMNPFPKKNILTKRANHRLRVEAELREFEVMRQDRSEKGSIASDEPSSGEDEG